MILFPMRYSPYVFSKPIPKTYQKCEAGFDLDKKDGGYYTVSRNSRVPFAQVKGLYSQDLIVRFVGFQESCLTCNLWSMWKHVAMSIFITRV